MIRLFKKFGYAVSGIAEAAKCSSFQIQSFAAIAVIFLMFYFPLANIERAILVLTIFSVLILETINTIIERYSDLVSAVPDPRVKKIKDLAAGAVLLSALSAVIIGFIIFSSHLFF